MQRAAAAAPPVSTGRYAHRRPRPPTIASASRSGVAVAKIELRLRRHPIVGEAMRHMERLLDVVPEREREERSLRCPR